MPPLLINAACRLFSLLVINKKQIILKLSVQLLIVPYEIFRCFNIINQNILHINMLIYMKNLFFTNIFLLFLDLSKKVLHLNVSRIVEE